MKATLQDLELAAQTLAPHMAPTPQYRWPLLSAELGVDLVVKHENHTPTGAFKVRGGLNFLARRLERGPLSGLISATRGNHGQSLAYACRAAGIPCTIVVPQGNSVEKNQAMRAFGADLIEAGEDFDAAKAHAADVASELGLEFAPSFAPELIAGVGTYALELFRNEPELDTVYVPIGLGSGICGLISARDALGLKTKIVGVVSDQALSYKLSFEMGNVVTTNSAHTFADGVAVREADPNALEIILQGADRIIAVSDDQIADAIRILYRTTHSVAEGAGAVPLAGVIAEKQQMQAKSVGVILCGQNIDTPKFAAVLNGKTPAP